ncbi:hypothetical protein D3C81_1566170 [compost metagenome]
MGLTGTQENQRSPLNRITHSVNFHLTRAVDKQMERIHIADPQMLIAAAVVLIRHDFSNIRRDFGQFVHAVRLTFRPRGPGLYCSIQATVQIVK